MDCDFDCDDRWMDYLDDNVVQIDDEPERKDDEDDFPTIEDNLKESEQLNNDVDLTRQSPPKELSDFNSKHSSIRSAASQEDVRPIVSSSQEDTVNASPSKRTRKEKAKAQPSIADEFFGVYCLISKSERACYKNRCYIGFTVDPNRRIRQHNGGRQAGGAGKTDNRGPWDMVCIVHGFPNSVSALRFEWAWQNPDKSRRLKLLKLRKLPKESQFAFRLRIVAHMLRSDPWHRLALTFRWLMPEYRIPFPVDLEMPEQMVTTSGLVQKTKTLISDVVKTHDRTCSICRKVVHKDVELILCIGAPDCSGTFHITCLAKLFVQDADEFAEFLTPIAGRCPRCFRKCNWGDLIRAQRKMLAVMGVSSTTEPDHCSADF